MKIQCKNCQSNDFVRNGKAREQQRYRCKQCGLNFIDGDKRRLNESRQLMRCTSVLFYSLGKVSFRFLAKVFDVSPTTVYQWIRSQAEELSKPVASGSIREIEIDEMWHFLQSKKTKNGFSKPWIVTHGELTPGLSVVVMRQR